MDNIVNLYMESVADIDNSSRHRDIEIPEVDELAICESYMALEEGRVMLEMYQRREIMYAESVGGIFVALIAFIKKAILIILKMVLGIKGLLLLVVIGLIMYFRRKKGNGISFSGGGGGSSSSSIPKLKIRSELMDKVFEKVTYTVLKDKYSKLSEPVVLLNADNYAKSNAEFQKLMSNESDEAFPKFILETALNAPGILLLSVATQLNVNRFIKQFNNDAVGISSNISNTAKVLYKDVQDDLLALLAPLKTQSVDFGNKESVDKFEKDSNEVLSKLYTENVSPKSIFNYGDISKILQVKSEIYTNLMNPFVKFNWVLNNENNDMDLDILFDNEKMGNQMKIYKIFSDLSEGKNIDESKISVIKEKIGKLSGYQNSIKSIVDKLDESNAIEDKNIISEINKWITLTISMTSSVMYSVQIGQVVKNVIESKIFQNIRKDILNIVTGKIKGKEKNLLQLVSGDDKENEDFIRTNYGEYLK